MRIVLLGATGYTGRLTAEAMVRAGLAPVLAGRRHDAVARLADRLAPLAPRPSLEPGIAVADAGDPASVRRLIESSTDVLVSTVGPFVEWGDAAVDAAVDAGAAYLDSTGEPPFIRRVFEHYGPRAAATGARLITAFGYDYVPGNLAGALAARRCRRAGRPATRLDIGYFIEGSFGISSGTRASAAGVLLAPSYARRGGALVERRSSGGRTRAFDLGRGRTWKGLPVAGSEHLALPLSDPDVADIEVWLGWAGKWTPAAAYAGTALGAVAAVPGAGDRAMRALRQRLGRTTGEGPDAASRAAARTVVQAEAFDAVGRALTTVRLEGPSPYDLTAELLAWGAAMSATHAVAPGAHGPVDAFGLDALERGCADMGLIAGAYCLRRRCADDDDVLAMTIEVELTEHAWRERAVAHAARVAPWIEPRLERRRRGLTHPVDDFLFDYYAWRPGQLARWHPGAGLLLTGDVTEFRGLRGYRVDDAGARVDAATVPVDILRTTLRLLEATETRAPSFGCFGRHEWAMVYRQSPDEIRHSAWPLRLPTADIAAVVESTPLRCTHFDAFRFYTSQARPLNVVQPTRETQSDLEQPGCLHATMDLYKWCFRAYPAIGSDLTADCFALAREVRAVDMRASPYDFQELGYAPIAIETAEGRAEYVEHQRDFAARGGVLRRRLIEDMRTGLDAARGAVLGNGVPA